MYYNKINIFISVYMSCNTNVVIITIITTEIIYTTLYIPENEPVRE